MSSTGAETPDPRELRDVLLRNGFVECDIAACNCGSWHARYGYIERFREIEDALRAHGIDLNGKTVLSALKEVLASQAGAEPLPKYPEHLPADRSAAFLDWWHEKGRHCGIEAISAEAGFEAARAQAGAEPLRPLTVKQAEAILGHGLANIDRLDHYMRKANERYEDLRAALAEPQAERIELSDADKDALTGSTQALHAAGGRLPPGASPGTNTLTDEQIEDWLAAPGNMDLQGRVNMKAFARAMYALAEPQAEPRKLEPAELEAVRRAEARLFAKLPDAQTKPAPEPVAWIAEGESVDLEGNQIEPRVVDWYYSDIKDFPVGTPLYASPIPPKGRE